MNKLSSTQGKASQRCIIRQATRGPKNDNSIGRLHTRNRTLHTGGNSIAGNRKETDGQGRGKEGRDGEDGEDKEAREDKEDGEVREEAELTHAVTNTLTPITHHPSPITAPQHTHTPQPAKHPHNSPEYNRPTQDTKSDEADAVADPRQRT